MPGSAGATGNIATEDLVSMLHEMGVETGIDLEALVAAARKAQRVLGRPLSSHVIVAGPVDWHAGMGAGRLEAGVEVDGGDVEPETDRARAVEQGRWATSDAIGSRRGSEGGERDADHVEPSRESLQGGLANLVALAPRTSQSAFSRSGGASASETAGSSLRSVPRTASACPGSLRTASRRNQVP